MPATPTGKAVTWPDGVSRRIALPSVSVLAVIQRLPSGPAAMPDSGPASLSAFSAVDVTPDFPTRPANPNGAP